MSPKKKPDDGGESIAEKTVRLILEEMHLRIDMEAELIRRSIDDDAYWETFTYSLPKLRDVEASAIDLSVQLAKLVERVEAHNAQ